VANRPPFLDPGASRPAAPEPWVRVASPRRGPACGADAGGLDDAGPG